MINGRNRNVDILRWIEFAEQLLDGGIIFDTSFGPGGIVIPIPGGGAGFDADDDREWPIDADELEELGIELPQPPPEPVEIPELSDDELVFDDVEKEIKVTVERDNPFFEEVKRNINWSRQFARDISRILEKGRKPRIRGTFETGPRINTSQLYRMKTEDNPRVYKRKSTPMPEPVEFIFLKDESASIRSLPRPMWELYRDFQWMIAEALAMAKQDFAMMGYANSYAQYKKLGEPYNDYIRTRMMPTATERRQVIGNTYAKGRWLGRAGGGSTYTAKALKEVRDLHRERNKIDNRRRVCIHLTDGQPSDGSSNVRRQVRDAHDENLKVIGVVLTRYGDNEPLIRSLTHQYDRMLILDPADRVESEKQLRHLLIRELKHR